MLPSSERSYCSSEPGKVTKDEMYEVTPSPGVLTKKFRMLTKVSLSPTLFSDFL